MFFRSERLFLRPAWPEDLDDAAQVLGQQAGVMSNIAASDLPTTAQALRDCLLRGAERLLAGLLITLPSARGTALIGGIGLARSDGEIGLGYWLSRDYWGHGYAAEAARGVLAVARGLGHHRVIARQSLDDRASLLVLTRAGFRPTGEHRAHGDGKAAVYVADSSAQGGGHDGLPQVRAA